MKKYLFFATPFLLCVFMFFVDDQASKDENKFSVDQVEKGDSIRILVKLKNYCFYDGSCTGFIKTGYEIFGDPENPLDTTIITDFVAEGEETVKRVDLAVASIEEQAVVDQFLKAVKIVNQYEITTNDKERQFPADYFYFNHPSAQRSYSGKIDAGAYNMYLFRIENISALKNFNFAGKLKIKYRNDTAQIWLTDNPLFSITTDSLFFDRTFRWLLEGERIPRPRPKISK